MSTILLSFEPEWFSLLEKNIKKFEYRKHFPKGKTTVYFYVSNPVKAITGIAEFDECQDLLSWKEKYNNRPVEVRKRIDVMAEDCRFVMPMLSFQKTTKIPLSKLKLDIPNFVVPRMYYYLDDLPLLEYLNSNLTPIGKKTINTFSEIEDCDIC